MHWLFILWVWFAFAQPAVDPPVYTPRVERSGSTVNVTVTTWNGPVVPDTVILCATDGTRCAPDGWRVDMYIINIPGYVCCMATYPITDHVLGRRYVIETYVEDNGAPAYIGRSDVFGADTVTRLPVVVAP